MLPVDTTTPESESTCSERRLAANRANAQLSTGPRTEEGKSKSSLNAVKTGLTGRTIVFADEEEAAAYRAHVERFLAYWQPANLPEHTLVQSLADTQWRLETIPGLESGVYARGRLRYAELYAEQEDPLVRRLLLHAHIEDVEAKTLKNLRLHERRLTNRFAAEKAELARLQAERRAGEEQQQRAAEVRQQAEEQRQRQEEEQRRREAKRAARQQARQAREEAQNSHPDGFVFSTPHLLDQPLLEPMPPTMQSE